MKKLAIATLIASTFAASAMATQVTVEAEDVSKSELELTLENVALPVAGLDLDLEVMRGDATDMTVGLDYKIEHGVANLATFSGVEIGSGDEDLLVELDNFYSVNDKLTAKVELEYEVVDGASETNNGEYEVGGSYQLFDSVLVGTSYSGQYAGKDVSELETFVTARLDEKVSVGVEHTTDFDGDTDSTEFVANYDFNQNVFAEATYTFEENSDDNALGLLVGYKF